MLKIDRIISDPIPGLILFCEDGAHNRIVVQCDFPHEMLEYINTHEIKVVGELAFCGMPTGCRDLATVDRILRA